METGIFENVELPDTPVTNDDGLTVFDIPPHAKISFVSDT
jgi:hypothetical protein